MTDQQTIWDWLKTERRHQAAKPAPELDDKGKPVQPFTDNRAALRKIRHSHGLEQPGRSRSQRLTNAQRRADRREHERKWRQTKRRERRKRAAEALATAAARRAREAAA